MWKKVWKDPGPGSWVKNQLCVLPGWTACNGGGRKPDTSLCKINLYARYRSLRAPVNCVVHIICGHVPRNPHMQVFNFWVCFIPSKLLVPCCFKGFSISSLDHSISVFDGT